MKKRILLCCVIGVFLLHFSNPLAFCEKAEEIIAKVIEAQGGKKTFESIKDTTMTCSAELTQQGLTGTVTVYKKEPDKRRIDFETMGMVFTRAYDGETAWWINPSTGTTEDMAEQQAAEIKRESLPVIAILYPKKYGLSFAYKGKEQIEGKDHFVIEQTYPDGFKATLYIDANSYMITKSKATTMGPMGQIEVEQMRSDFKEVNGMKVPHTIISYQDGEEYMKITVEELNFNTGIKDSLFKKE